MKSRKNIILLYFIAFLQGMVFYAPIASLYRQAAGLSLVQIVFIESILYHHPRHGAALGGSRADGHGLAEPESISALRHAHCSSSFVSPISPPC